MVTLSVSILIAALSNVEREKLLSDVRMFKVKTGIPFTHQRHRGGDMLVSSIIDPVITGGVIDSRQAFLGSLFVALKGETSDGHDYLDDAFEHGALVALVQKDMTGRFQVLDLRLAQDLVNAFTGTPSEITSETIGRAFANLDWRKPVCIWVNDPLQALQKIAGFWRDTLNLRVIGITGSVGKSTTKELVAEVLGQRFFTLKNPGNLNNEIGLPVTLLSLTEAHERAVLEMGFYVPGEIAFLCGLAKPHVGVVTTISMVHAERAGSQDAIARGKAELVESLPEAPTGVAILNFDDPWVRMMAAKTRARVFYYGNTPEANLWVDEIEGFGLEGIRFRLHYRNEVLYMRVPMIGRHSVSTAMRATAVGLVEGLSWQEIVDGLHTGRSQLRLLAVPSSNGAIILDDTYNSEPASALAALNLLDEMEGRKVAVLGDMLELGVYEQQGHEMVGIRASKVVDELVTVGERGKIIAAAAWKGGLSKKMISSYQDVDQAIIYLQKSLKTGDVVLVKGSRGMRMERIVAALEAGA